MGRQPVISHDQMLHLAKIVQGITPGNRLRALHTMVKGNLRIVLHIWSSKYQHTIHSAHPSLADILQAGSYGLQTACEKFDPERGYKFSSMAYWWVIKSMNEWFNKEFRTIKLPSNAYSVYKQFGEMTFNQKLPKKEVLKILSSKFKVSPECCQFYIESVDSTNCSSVEGLNAARSENSARLNLEIVDPVTVDDKSDEDYRNEQIQKVFDLVASRAQLDPHERDILLLAASGVKMAKIGELLGIDHPYKVYSSVLVRFKSAGRNLGLINHNLDEYAEKL